MGDLGQRLCFLQLVDSFHLLLQVIDLTEPVRLRAVHQQLETLLLIFIGRLLITRYVVFVLHVGHVIYDLGSRFRPQIADFLVWQTSIREGDLTSSLFSQDSFALILSHESLRCIVTTSRGGRPLL